MARVSFFVPIKVTGMLKTRGKLGNDLPSAGHPLAPHDSTPHRELDKYIRGGVGWRAGKEHREKVPLGPKRPPSCDAVSGERNSCWSDNELSSL